MLIDAKTGFVLKSGLLKETGGDNRLNVIVLLLSKDGETDVKIRSFPIVHEGELRQMVAAGAEIEILCIEEADKDNRNRGGWVITVHHDDEPLVLVGFRAKHRIFKRFEGLCGYCAHTLGLGEIRVPIREGHTARGMYHRDHMPAGPANPS